MTFRARSARESFMPRPLINFVKHGGIEEVMMNNRLKQSMTGRAAMKLTVLTQN